MGPFHDQGAPRSLGKGAFANDQNTMRVRLSCLQARVEVQLEVSFDVSMLFLSGVLKA
jgi:hypothetical protein